MSGLGTRARRLALARGLGRVDAPSRPVALVWTRAEVEIDRTTLRDDELVVSDYVLMEQRVGEPSFAARRDRVTRDPLDYGRVVDPDGVVIGRVLRGPRGGALLEYAFPAERGRSA